MFFVCLFSHIVFVVFVFIHGFCALVFFSVCSWCKLVLPLSLCMVVLSVVFVLVFVSSFLPFAHFLFLFFCVRVLIFLMEMNLAFCTHVVTDVCWT